MNEIGNKLLLVGDKVMPEMNLIQPGFMYNTQKERTQKEFKVYLSKLTR